jgi:hypothetical protein
MNTASKGLRVPLLTPWIDGPVDGSVSPITVSVTEFQPHERRVLPSVALRGLRMRMGWYAMRGAIGMWLWTLPTSARGGSISVWASEDDLARFVALPHHVEIMQRYGPRGTVRSTTWQADRFEPPVVVERARTWITGRST